MGLWELGMVVKLFTEGARDKSPSSSLLELSAAEPVTMEAAVDLWPPDVEVWILDEVEAPPVFRLATEFPLAPTPLLLAGTEVKYGTSGSKRP